MTLLEVKNLTISFGGLRAVDDFNIEIKKGQLYGLIGPNGAGKTTVFNLLTGVYKPDEGIIKLEGRDITGLKTIDINKSGIARTFQNIRLFKELTVLDNVKAGLHNHYHYSTIEGILRLPKYYKVEKEMNERAMDLLYPYVAVNRNIRIHFSLRVLTYCSCSFSASMTASYSGRASGAAPSISAKVI